MKYEFICESVESYVSLSGHANHFSHENKNKQFLWRNWIVSEFIDSTFWWIFKSLTHSGEF